MRPFFFALEVLMAYVPYRMWLRTKKPITDDKNTLAEIAKWKGPHCMPDPGGTRRWVPERYVGHAAFRKRSLQFWACC